MLGELYHPRGAALETAQQVLEVDTPMACNIALGCSNKCSYCFGNKSPRGYFKKVEGLKQPTKSPVELVTRQLDNGLNPHGIFLSFLTDILIPQNVQNTFDLLELLVEQNIRTATLSKLQIRPPSYANKIRWGTTVVSIDDDFYHIYEQGTYTHPLERIKFLKHLHNGGVYTWILMEPYPTPILHPQKIEKVLKKIDFVDFIIFGKWNYEPKAYNPNFYKQTMDTFTRYCIETGIRHHIKSGTMKHAAHSLED